MPGLEGTSLGRYHLQRRLGRGGMSEVYLAYDELMHRDVAIKVVSSSHVEYIERFQREAMAIANLHHNHILPAFDYGEQEPWHYLADFGLAKAINETDRVRKTGVLLGTPEYMAPEPTDGPASRSSDLYALGKLLYQMVTGELPFTGNTGLAVYMKQVHERPIPPSRFNPTIPQDVE